MLTISYLNVYVGNRAPRKAIDRMLAREPDSFGVGEAMRSMSILAGRLRYRLHRATGRTSQRRGVADTPILTHKRYMPLGTLAMQISKMVEPTRIAPERWVVVSLFEHPLGKVAHVNIHPNAQVQNKTTARPHVDQYARSVTTLRRLLRFLLRCEYLVVLTGDLNYRVNKVQDPWSPYLMFDELGMKYRATGIDAVAWSPNLRVVDWKTVPREETGSDHNGLEVDFELNPHYAPPE